MIMADGITPSNEGRGYVLRRLLRRVIRSVRLLGYDGPVLPELLPVSRDAMAPSYPEVATDFGRISTYAYAEEEAFAQTLRRGHHDLRHRGRARSGRPAAARCPGTRRSSCTTRTASRSTSPWRWRPSRGCPSTRTASAG